MFLAPSLGAALVARSAFGSLSGRQALGTATVEATDTPQLLREAMHGTEVTDTSPSPREGRRELLDLVMFAQSGTIVHSGERLRGAASSSRVQGKLARLRWMIQCGA